MSEEFVNIEVNGVPMKARKGENIIRATDREGVYVPRFCYHDKLPIAANCRMCLVEVEKAPKPLRACATPVAEGMKIYTHSVKAIGAQPADGVTLDAIGDVEQQPELLARAVAVEDA